MVERNSQSERPVIEEPVSIGRLSKIIGCDVSTLSRVVIEAERDDPDLDIKSTGRMVSPNDAYRIMDLVDIAKQTGKVIVRGSAK
jgi:hypothetical protein